MLGVFPGLDTTLVAWSVGIVGKFLGRKTVNGVVVAPGETINILLLQLQQMINPLPFSSIKVKI